MKKPAILLFFISLTILLSAGEIEIKKISENVIILNEGYDRVSAIKTKKGIVIIDTHKNTYKMGRCFDLIKKEFGDSTIAYLINTHDCAEHIGGNSMFPNTKKIASCNFFTIQDTTNINRASQFDGNINKYKEQITKETDSLKLEQLKGKLSWFTNMRQDYIAASVSPDICISDSLILDLGSHTLELRFAGEGAHGKSGILIYCKEEKILFTGSAYSFPQKIYKSSNWSKNIDVPYWIQNIEYFLAKSELEHIIPSHLTYYSIDDLKEIKNYCKLLWSTLNNCVDNNKSIESIYLLIPYELISKQYNMFEQDKEDHKQRHEENIQFLYEYLKSM